LIGHMPCVPFPREQRKPNRRSYNIRPALWTLLPAA
jgi:hypothetical protein